MSISRVLSSSLLCSASLTALLVTQAHAVDVVISANQTTTVTIAGDGDTVTVNDGVAVDTSATGGAHGVRLRGSSQTLTNNGTIIGEDVGVSVGGSNNTIFNNGAITGVSRWGVYFEDRDAVSSTLINRGSITSGGSTGARFSETDGSHGVMQNYGDITTTGNNQDAFSFGSTDGYAYMFSNMSGGRIWTTEGEAVYLSGSGSAFTSFTNHAGGQIWATEDEAIYSGSTHSYFLTLTNFGDIWSTSNDDAAIYFSHTGGNGNRLINYGTIRSSSASIFAVRFINSFDAAAAAAIVGDHAEIDTYVVADNEIINFGLIESTANGAIIIGNGATDIVSESITNGGIIRAANGFNAIQVESGVRAFALNLLVGSVIDGGVNFGGMSDTLNIGNGLNLVLDYDGVLENVTSGIPFVHDVGNTIVYSVDTTGFSALDSFTGLTSGAVHDVAHAAANGGVPSQLPSFNAFFDTRSAGVSAGDQPFEAFDEAEETSLWATAFGGFQSSNNGGTNLDSDMHYGGMMIGGTWEREGVTYGGYVGGSTTDLDVANAVQDVDAFSAFAGLFAAQSYGDYWLSVNAVAGFSSFESDRHIANNAGAQTASADYTGFFLSTSVEGTRAITETTDLSVALGYTASFFDDYQETGSSANLTVEDRFVHTFNARAALEQQVYQHQSADGVFELDLSVGAESTFQLGGNQVDATLAGNALSFSTGSDDVTHAAFAGLEANLDMADSGWELGAAGQVYVGTGDLLDVRGQLTARLTF